MLASPRLLTGGTYLEPKRQPEAGRIELLFVGRQPVDNPGAPAKQADCFGKMSDFLRLKDHDNLVLICPHNDHRGGLATVVSKTQKVICDNSAYSIRSSVASSRFCDPCQRMWGLGYMDGAIFDLAGPRGQHDAELIYCLSVRVLDCAAIFGYDGRYAFGVHVSHQTLAGYAHPEQFTGSILKRLFASGIDATNTRIWMSPAISGVVDDCSSCYDYTEAPDQTDGTRLSLHLLDEYPNLKLEDGLIRYCAESCKLDFDLCAIISQILQLHGVPADNIDTSCNLCTRCHADTWYSDRVDRHDQSPEGIARHQQRVGNQMLMYIKA